MNNLFSLQNYEINTVKSINYMLNVLNLILLISYIHFMSSAPEYLHGCMKLSHSSRTNRKDPSKGQL